jgi:flagellin-specific chaperone FliS
MSENPLKNSTEYVKNIGGPADEPIDETFSAPESEFAKDDDYKQAMEFVESHRAFFEHYARGGIKIEPAPAGLDTFAFDLQKNTIYISPRFYEALGLSQEKTTFATLHEIEHFLEKKSLLTEDGGARVFDRYLKKIKESRAFALMDNCVADIRENRAVVSKTSQSFRDLERSCYTDDLFKQTDFIKEPKHIQFCYSILREARVPDEVCNIDSSVRAKIDELRDLKSEDGIDFISVITDPDVPMSTRLSLQDEYIWPIVKELLEEDMKEREKQEGQSGDDKDGSTDKSDNKSEGESGNGEGDDKKSPANSKAQNSKKQNPGKSSSSGSKSDQGKQPPENPNDIFKSAYDKADKKVPNAVPMEQLEKAFEQWKEQNRESPADKADSEYAKKIGVKKEDLQKYRKIAESLKSVVNPETGQSVVEDLKELISKIIAKRKKQAPAPRYPIEEGEDLVDPAHLVAEVKAGNFEPKAWETFEMKEKMGKKFGEVEISLVCDCSDSMNEGGKIHEQMKSVVLVMEALKDLQDLSEEENVNLIKPLEIRSEVYSFKSSSDDSKPIKKMSKELSEKERIDVMSAISSAPGSTTDFVPLESIYASLEKEVKDKVREGELKKIVIVFTDGGSDDTSRVSSILQKMREDGLVVIGIGVTESGAPALTTYAPEAKLAETAVKLPLVLGDILKEHLADV